LDFGNEVRRRTPHARGRRALCTAFTPSSCMALLLLVRSERAAPLGRDARNHAKGEARRSGRQAAPQLPHRMKGQGRSRCSFAREQRSSRSGEANLRAVRRQTRNAPRSPMEPISRPENSGAIGWDRGVSAREAEFPVASDERLGNAPAHRAARRVSGGIAAGGHVRELSFSDVTVRGAGVLVATRRASGL
jgi:hypothetical protein